MFRYVIWNARILRYAFGGYYMRVFRFLGINMSYIVKRGSGGFLVIWREVY
jgi:hypothetical protein